MKIAIVTRHVPATNGSASGRVLFALVEGLRAEGHQVRAWSWGPAGPAVASGSAVGGVEAGLPEWCEPRMLPPETWWRSRARALVWPRRDAARLELPIEEDEVAVADTPVSYAAIAAHPRSVLTVHYSAWLDLKAVGPRSPSRLQDVRAERGAARRAALTIAYSDRVARHLPSPAVVAPIAYPMPDEPLEPARSPVAACIADWRWPPNAAALRLLLVSWPLVREQLPASSLLLAGPGLERGAGQDGVTSLGPVDSSADVLGRSRLMVFPCLPTSGPKVKVLEALASGVAVVTTASGAEGLWLDDEAGLVLSPPDPPSFAAAVAGLLDDPERCAVLGRRGRIAVARHHAPRPAARARIEALSRLA